MNVSSVKFAEVDACLNILIRTPLQADGPYFDSDIFSYTSYIDGDDMASILPPGLTLAMIGMNEKGKEVVNSSIILFSESCEVIPEFQGKQTGWANFVCSYFF